MVATFAKGTGGAAKEKAEYYGQPTLPEGIAERADYYLRGVSRGDLVHTAAVPRPDMSPEMAALLGLDVAREATVDEVANLIAGLAADGAALPGNQRGAVYKDGRTSVTYYDFTFSAPGSVSIAFALAPTQAERAVILQAHEEAAAAGMAHLEERIAQVRRGAAGSHGADRGEMAWVSFVHVSSRPTVPIVQREADGTDATFLATVPEEQAPDMGLHTHNITPAVVRLPDGTVGKPDTLALHNFVKQAGGVYHFTLATRLKAAGVDYGIDPRTELGHIRSVPRPFVDAMSKRSQNGAKIAREMARAKGRDWDRMSAAEQKDLLKEGVQGKGQRRRKNAEVWAEEKWRKQAADFGYEHGSVLDPTRRGEDATPAEERRRIGYEAALPMLERRFASNAVLDASEARVVAARGLIAAPSATPADLDAVVGMMRERGVRHGGEATKLVVVEVHDRAADGLAATARGAVKLTTTAHLDQETEAMRLIAEAAADRSGGLSERRVEDAVARVSERDGIDFTTATGQEQRRIIDTIAASGRFVAVIGGAGTGKSTLLRVPVEAWKAEGRQVFAVALAWKQARPLTEAGIADENAMALDKLLHGARSGRIALDRDSVVVVDELGQIGTPHQLALARLQAEHGFTLVAVGDDAQNPPVAHGNPFALIRRAVGAERVPEITATVRQKRERDRETVLLLRAGRGADAVARLREDGRAHLVPGGYEQAVEAAAALWDELATKAAASGMSGATVSVSTFTNQEARDISAAIRERRRTRGDLAARDTMVLPAQDQGRDGFAAFYDLPLAVGDRVRLFDLVRVSTPGKAGAPIFATNGGVVRIEGFTGDGFEATNAAGFRRAVAWDALRDPDTGRVRLTYGDAVSNDAIQSATDTHHIAAYPGGTAGVHSKKAHVAVSRAREETHVVLSDGAERAAIRDRRAIGDDRPVTRDDVYASVAGHFSRNVRKELAVELLERANRFQVGTRRGFAPAMEATERHAAAGEAPGATPAASRQRRDETAAAEVTGRLAEATKARGEAAKRIGVAHRAAREAAGRRRSARPAAQRPKQATKPQTEAKPARAVRKPVSMMEAEAEFRAELHRAGLRFGKRDRLQMDGNPHYLGVEGSKSRRGFYVAHLEDGWPAGTIINHKTGTRIDWVASADGRKLTPEQEATERAKQEAAKAKQAEAQARRDAERQQRQAAAGRKAEGEWRRARPADAGHPYLVKKGVEAHGLRVDRRGALLVPMRHADGRMAGVQSIAPDGGKLFTKDTAKTGAFAVLGDLRPGETVVIAEGFATAATVRESTGLPVVVAFDAGNLAPVAAALRRIDPAARFVFAADNDHHLPRQNPPLDNVGLEKARLAAAEFGGVVILPQFGIGDPGTDWNDYAKQHGQAAAKAALQKALAAHGIHAPEQDPAQAQGQAQSQAPTAAASGTPQDRRDAARGRISRQQQTPAQQAAEQSRRAQEATRGAGHAPSH